MGAKLQTKDEIFNAAAEIADPDKRAAYLREVGVGVPVEEGARRHTTVAST